MHVELTVADHDKNGFLQIARWPTMTEEDARRFIATVDETVDDDAEPDRDDAPFWFMLDLMDEEGSIHDNSMRRLPTQTVMALAPAEVQRWLNERPDMNLLGFQLLSWPLPTLPIPAIAKATQPN